MDRVQPFPGVREAFRRCTSAGSSSPSDRLPTRRRSSTIWSFRRRRPSGGLDVEGRCRAFQAVSGNFSGSARARHRLNTLTVGDTPYDILASHRAPLPIAAVFCGGFPREPLTKAEFLFDDVAGMVKEINRSMSTSTRVRCCTAARSSSTATATRPIACSPQRPHRRARSRGAADLRSLQESGITASFFAAYVPPFYAGRGAALRVHSSTSSTPRWRRPDALTLCTDSAGIRAAKRDGKLAIMIGVEGGHAIEDSLDILRDFYSLGARYMTLTHVNTNNWCDSSGDAPRHNGLTDFGRDVVRTMNDLGMIVDISHVSDAAFRDVLETTRVPVVATHSSCRALCRHPRNMTDDMLRDLAKNGGVCMINFFSAFLNDDVAQVIMPRQEAEEE